MHDRKPKIEWKANFDSWPLNTEMETKCPISICKASKRLVDSTRDTNMEEGHINKKYRSQGLEEEEEEEEVGIQLEKLVFDHLGFHINLKNPPPITTLSTYEVVIPNSQDNGVASRSS